MMIKVSITINNQQKIFSFDNELTIRNTIDTIINNAFNYGDNNITIYSTRNQEKLMSNLTFKQAQILTGDNLYVQLSNSN